DAVVVLKPKLAIGERRDGEIAVALNPCAGELRDIAELVDLARGLGRRNGAKAGERADQRERIGPAPEGEGSAPDPGPGDEELGHRHRPRRPDPSNVRGGRDARRRTLAAGERQKTEE